MLRYSVCIILRGLIHFSIIIGLLAPASAQERVTVGTLRQAAAQGYFKAEGLDVEMTAYPSEQAVVEALSLGATDFGVTAFGAAAFNLAAKGAIKAIAAQARLDAADIARQVEWYKAQGLVDQSVDARAVVDLSFNK
ncbi:MAG: hypothetical protein EXR03_06470 [Pseudolabrys sp.]|nr:hypothetical protein [Pseudolabrys sp.]MSP32448.1 hypothetical protein [Pseudolabrys sp.]